MRLEMTKTKHRKGLWSPDEDKKLSDYVLQNRHVSWTSVPGEIGLQRNGKSCRLRWINYLRPGLKRGTFSKSEEELILSLHRDLGNKWSRIAQKLPGRTDNEIKNHWHTNMKKRSLTKVTMTAESQELDSMSSLDYTAMYSGLMPKVIFEEWLFDTKSNRFDDQESNVFNGSRFMDDDELLLSLDEGSMEFESGSGWSSYGVVLPNCLDLGSSAVDDGMCSTGGFNRMYSSD